MLAGVYAAYSVASVVGQGAGGGHGLLFLIAGIAGIVIVLCLGGNAYIKQLKE